MASQTRSSRRSVGRTSRPATRRDRSGGPQRSTDGGRRTPAHRFDEFYNASWHPLLLQTFAYCGDLTLAREALRRAFVDAWHHWNRAENRGPEEYVRSGAFSRAQRRGRTRTFQRSQRGSTEDRTTLKALQDLPPQLRRSIVLAVLSQIELHDIGRSLGEPESRTLDLIDTAMAQLSQALEREPNEVARRMNALAGPARAAAQPTARDIRGRGVRRRQTWLGGGIAAVVALTLVGGWFVLNPTQDDEKLPPSLGPEVTEALLLPVASLEPLGKPENWTIESTTDNTVGDGINSFCQASRFADPQGLRAYVRTYDLDGIYQRKATQTIELSRTERQSRSAYERVLSWYGGCSTSRLQLLSTFDVRGLGDQAQIIKMRAQKADTSSADLSSYAVGVVRTGHILTWTTFVTEGAQNPSTDDLVAALGNALTRACTSKAAGTCADTPAVKENPPPPSGEQAGMLAVTDLPAVPSITQKWVGTDAESSPANPAATTCDATDMDAAGANPALTRTFLTPGADVPPRFGLSETVGQFDTAVQARGLITQIVNRMDKCPDRDPGAHLSQTGKSTKSVRGSAWYFWRLESEINDQDSIVYWMGVARAGSSVAQVTFVPGDGKQDISKETFRSLVQRARDRLFELPVRAGPTSSPSASSGASSGASGNPSPSLGGSASASPSGAGRD